MSRHQVLDETWCPRAPLGHQKYSNTVILSAKLRFSAFHVKWLWGWVLGCFLGRFWEPSWCQVGPCWAPSWLKMALENHSKNWVVKKSRGQKKNHAGHASKPPCRTLNTTNPPTPRPPREDPLDPDDPLTRNPATTGT